MVAETTSFFQDRGAEELIMPSPDARPHKHIGRGVPHFDNVIWYLVREDVVLAGTFAKFSQNPAMRNSAF